MPAKDPSRRGGTTQARFLEVSDVPRAIAYYRDVFGLTPAWMWEDRIGGVHTDYGSIEIYLARAERPSPSRLAVFVDDANAAHQSIERQVPRSSTVSKRGLRACAGSPSAIPMGP
jgi:Glyoxalase/Bleomycin resistance protein/Dioxygenase superfamily